jgi:hypothetical protein
VKDLPLLHANRYVQPLREGGSMPAIVDTEDGLFVVKFRGAGQGPKALIAELVVGLLAQHIGLRTPDLALIDLSSEFGRSEPDPEIQDLLRASHGINIGLRFLDGAFNFDPAAAGDLVTAQFASLVVWLDAFVTNVDRTHRNPNLLIWEREPWLIDHGAALYAHHNWDGVDEAKMRSPFPLIQQHVLLRAATDLAAADAHASTRLDADILRDVLMQVPEALFTGDGMAATTQASRDRYVTYLLTRLAEPRAFVEEAISARARAADAPPLKVRARR